ncbi:Bacteriorhodopsin-like protein [Robiginitalea myxolifaciens]|uniref:Bacteriorhodopsin-like protein n=1 Tax=Robiginitalea myxolifaciens TaxID=400055 RepID=A0A1I6FYF6_9FLAO|nr:bacteriorhodopsin [Robiginitalea myxolifaciens]SFR34968.1 Bacteriorhodopsin-like protein [Robiginitalea myxolifaciens]
MNETINANFENFIGLTEGYSEMAYQMVSHVLTLGYAVMLAGLLYFVLTLRTVSPKYRMSNILSGVVMVSAFLLLFAQAGNWTSSFQFNAEAGRYFLNTKGDLFNNGYRYLNWLIDVPMLLFQILFVVSLTKSNFKSVRNQFWFSGTLMILTGYVGQFYEVSNPTAFFVWGAISTVFFFHILWLMRKVIQEGKEGIPKEAQKVLGSIWTLFLVSWFLYPGAYLMPHLLGLEGGFFNETGVVARQITYTIADVSSKVIYGVLLGNVAMILSRNEGYDYKKLI